MVNPDAYEDAERMIADEQSVPPLEQARTVALARAIGRGVHTTQSEGWTTDGEQLPLFDLPVLASTIANVHRKGRVIE